MAKKYYRTKMQVEFLTDHELDELALQAQIGEALTDAGLAGNCWLDEDDDINAKLSKAEMVNELTRAGYFPEKLHIEPDGKCSKCGDVLFHSKDVGFDGSWLVNKEGCDICPADNAEHTMEEA